ncbi:MAG: hypothetical protein QNL12_03065 [Acidimicrobiia bacterium]|nr:hypothetical protein [Acidimicrobiia bacterium]
MFSFGILIAICVGVVLAIRWMGRRSAEITEYYSESDDPTAETLLRTNEMRGNHL